MPAAGNLAVSYKIVISDDSSKGSSGKIVLKKFAGKGGSAYIFEWGSKDTDVISWSPQYDGSVAIFTSGKNGKTKEYVISQFAENGDDVTEVAYTATTESKSNLNEGKSWADSWDSVEGFSNAVGSITDFEQRANYPYKGTLEVLGVSDDRVSLVNTRITIIPLVNGKRHHTAGIYTVVGITDKISSQGFTTTLEVVRYSDVTGTSSSEGLSGSNKKKSNNEDSKSK